MALDAQKMGHKVFLVIEKMTELQITLEESERLELTPCLGVRARLDHKVLVNGSHLVVNAQNSDLQLLRFYNS